MNHQKKFKKYIIKALGSNTGRSKTERFTFFYKWLPIPIEKKNNTFLNGTQYNSKSILLPKKVISVEKPYPCQPVLICSKLTIQTLELCVKYVQS